ncbi:MAG TPA: hypothetical protein VG734_01835 [Lacunisphaera sp.]|nr:hypothetical protein [Lacunisphaera sp.]
MSETVSAESQAAGVPDRILVDAVTAIERECGLKQGECVGDVLAACGTDAPTPDDVAACSARFSGSALATLELVILLGPDAYRLARLAGLLMNGNWQPHPQNRGVAVVHALHIGEAAVAACKYLVGTKPARQRKGPTLVSDDDVAQVAGLLGAHRFTSKWTGSNYNQVPARGVREHLRGRTLLAVAPRKDWRFVVVEVLRQSAVQHAAFQETMDQLVKLLPGAIALAGDNGGWVYVPVPSVRYIQAALYLRAFLGIHELLWCDVGCDGSLVRVSITAVSTGRLVLPFAGGSRFVNNKSNFSAQVQQFVQAVQLDKGQLYADIVATVREKCGLRSVWSATTKRKIGQFLFANSVAHLKPATLPPNALSSSWSSALQVLSIPAQDIAIHGSSTWDSIEVWAAELLTELGRRLPRDQVEALMREWAAERQHAGLSRGGSSDVVRRIDMAVARYYANRTGVPVRFWDSMKSHVSRNYHRALQRGNGLHFGQRAPRAANQLALPDLLATAFSIAEQFYRGRINERKIWEERFEEFTGDSTASDVEKILTRHSWLVMVRKAVPDVAPRVYRLASRFWPARPHESRVYAPV